MKTHTLIKSPLGTLTVVADSGLLSALYFADHAVDPEELGGESPAAFGDVAAQLEEYFAGSRRSFKLETRLSGTEFQHSVWAALGAIPYGERRSYRDIAVSLGDSFKARAVGHAIARLPVPVIIPAHRVVSAHGSLSGSTSVTWRKKLLLELEARHCEAAG